MAKFFSYYWILIITLWACGNSDNSMQANIEDEVGTENTGSAAITNVTVSGSVNAYTFSVTISSPDLGCNQYADWWEVTDTEGNLIYRRILAHSHVNEQPFTRSGGEVQVSASTEVYVRAHMNNSGYSTKAFRGTVQAGFSAFDLSDDFASDLESTQPLPDGCAF
ncbi:MAG: hypothetical protein AAGA43_00195 [Bacteroidota bacterium]